MHEHFSPQQSLQLIQSMIDKTRANISENRFYFLLWGWLTLSAILGQFLLKVVFLYRHHYLVYLVTIPALFLTIRHARQKGRRPYRTYIGHSMSNLWTGIGISFFVLVFIISAGIGWRHGWPFMILMYGLGTFISGKILQFKPLVVGGIINWLLACACVFVPYDYQILLAAAAIVCSYIIPGYMIRSNR